MSKARIYGHQTACVPNRDADRRRGSKFFRSKQDWTWNHDEKLREREERKECETMALLKMEQFSEEEKTIKEIAEKTGYSESNIRLILNLEAESE